MKGYETPLHPKNQHTQTNCKKSQGFLDPCYLHMGLWAHVLQADKLGV